MTLLDWLLDSDPSIRWQVMRDLTDEPADVVAAERARVAHEGWGARLLAAQPPDGVWGGGANFPEWTGTKPTMAVLRTLGPDPANPDVRRAVDLVRDNCKWEHDGQDFFDGEVEPCIYGATVAIGDYFGQEIGEGEPSRCNTLRAMRVLRRYDAVRGSVSSGAGAVSAGGQ